MGVGLTCIQKPEQGNKEAGEPNLIFAKNNDDVLSKLASSEAQIAGATHFFWAKAQTKVKIYPASSLSENASKKFYLGVEVEDALNIAERIDL